MYFLVCIKVFNFTQDIQGVVFLAEPFAYPVLQHMYAHVRH